MPQNVLQLKKIQQLGGKIVRADIDVNPLKFCVKFLRKVTGSKRAKDKKSQSMNKYTFIGVPTIFI